MRLCDSCGRPYYRRNLTELWDTQSPGSRTGWHKTRGRICTQCMGQTKARRFLMVAHIRLGKASARRRAI